MRLEVTVIEHGDGTFRGTGVMHGDNGHTTTFGPDAYPIFEATAEKARARIIRMAQDDVNKRELARRHRESQVVSYEEVDIFPTI